MDVIQAKNEYALRSSMDQLRGSVQKAIRDIREKLIYHIAYIESALDGSRNISVWMDIPKNFWKLWIMNRKK